MFFTDLLGREDPGYGFWYMRKTEKRYFIQLKEEQLKP